MHQLTSSKKNKTAVVQYPHALMLPSTGQVLATLTHSSTFVCSCSYLWPRDGVTASLLNPQPFLVPLAWFRAVRLTSDVAIEPFYNSAEMISVWANFSRISVNESRHTNTARHNFMMILFPWKQTEIFCVHSKERTKNCLYRCCFLYLILLLNNLDAFKMLLPFYDKLSSNHSQDFRNVNDSWIMICVPNWSALVTVYQLWWI